MSNLFNNRIVSGAASKAVTGNLYQSQQSSLNLKKEVFEHKDCITISTYQSLYVLETCNSILESVLDSMDDEDDESSVVMLSSVIAAFIYSHDFNNSKIIKKRIQLMMDNKLVKTTAIQDNDYFTGYGVLDLNSEMPDMTEDVKYEDFQQKFYNPVFEKKLLISLQAVLSNEIMLLHQKMKHLEHRVKFDFSKSMNKYFVGLTDEFVKVYDLIPQFAVVLEDDTSEVYHLLTGLHTMSNVLTTVKAVYKDDILEFINADIMEFKNPFYSLHQLYGALLAQSRMITVLVNMAKQFLHTNVNYIKEGELVLNDDPALINILNSLMQIDAKILHPAINLCSEFCVENSMLVNQNENVVFNLKEKYSDKLNNLFDNLTELLGNMVDVLMINFDEDHPDVNVDAQKNYFKSMEAMVSKTQKTNPNLKYAYIPSRMDSLDSTKRNQHYTKVGSSDALNSKITKTAGSFSQMSISSMSSASSQTASPSNSTGSSRQNSMSNEKKIVRTRQPTTPSKPTGRTRASSVSSNASVVVGRARGSSVSSNASAAPGRSRSSSVNSAFHNTLKLSPLKKNNVSVAKPPTNVPQEETSADTSSTSYDADAADEYKKVRFQGVPKYPMVYESIKPTRKGWYSKPAVLHYPLIPDQYSSSIDSINTVPVSKERQMEGFAFKHINSLFKKIKD